MAKIKKYTLLTIEYVFLSLVAFVSIFPFVWMLISTTNYSADVIRNKLTLGSALIDNLNGLLQPDKYFITGLVNTSIIAVVTTVLSLLVCSLAGYGFVIYRSRKRDNLFKALMLTMMIPFSSIMVPLYRMFAQLSNIPGLDLIGMNTLGAMIAPSISGAFLIFFFRQNTRSFSREMIEAARIDGLSELGIFFRIFFPVMRPTFAAATIMTFITSWNSYLWPLLVAQSEDVRVLSMVLSALGQSYTADYGVLMTAIVIATLPSALIYFLMQKQFVEGMTGAVK